MSRTTGCCHRTCLVPCGHIATESHHEVRKWLATPSIVAEWKWPFKCNHWSLDGRQRKIQNAKQKSHTQTESNTKLQIHHANIWWVIEKCQTFPITFRNPCRSKDRESLFPPINILTLINPKQPTRDGHCMNCEQNSLVVSMSRDSRLMRRRQRWRGSTKVAIIHGAKDFTSDWHCVCRSHRSILKHATRGDGKIAAQG